MGFGEARRSHTILVSDSSDFSKLRVRALNGSAKDKPTIEAPNNVTKRR